MRRYTWLNLIIQKKQLGEKKKRRTRKSVCLCLRVCSISQLWLMCRSFKIICINFLSLGAEHALPDDAMLRVCRRYNRIKWRSRRRAEQLLFKLPPEGPTLSLTELNWITTHNCAFLEARDLFAKWHLPLLDRINWDFHFVWKKQRSLVLFPYQPGKASVKPQGGQTKEAKLRLFFFSYGAFFSEFCRTQVHEKIVLYFCFVCVPCIHGLFFAYKHIFFKEFASGFSISTS